MHPMLYHDNLHHSMISKCPDAVVAEAVVEAEAAAVADTAFVQLAVVAVVFLVSEHHYHHCCRYCSDDYRLSDANSHQWLTFADQALASVSVRQRSQTTTMPIRHRMLVDC
jgi:hypothetical protein